MKGNFFAVGVALTIGSIYSLTAFSQARPESLVKQRQSAMTLQGKYFYPQTRPMAQGKIPYDATVMARNAAFLDALSKMPWDGFTPATREVKSGATPAVFTEVGKFQEAQQQYMAEVSKLLTLTRSGDEAAVKAQVLAIDKSCNSCHDTFQEKR